MNCAPDVLIIGAGLSGLATAFQLRQHGVTAQVIEARSRVGGRTCSVRDERNAAVADLGAAWIWPHQRYIGALVETLSIEAIPQYESGFALFETGADVDRFEPPGAYAALRFRAGAQVVCDRLAEELTGQLRLNARATAVARAGEAIIVTLDSGESLRASQVVLALPPRVILNTIAFTPSLPDALHQALQQTHTWMGNTAKAVVTFDRPFWRERGLSGFAVSHVGPLRELHDASPEDASRGVIMGFFTGVAHFDQSSDMRRERVVAQIQRVYDGTAEAVRGYQDVAWWQDDLSAAPDDLTPLSAHPHYGGGELAKGHWDDRLFFAGAETASEHGGYMDGAVEGAMRSAMLLTGS